MKVAGAREEESLGDGETGHKGEARRGNDQW